MARRDEDQPRKRFTKSGHTSHAPRVPPPARPASPPPAPPYDHGSGYAPGPGYPPSYGAPPGHPGPVYRAPVDPHGRPTYPQGPAPNQAPKPDTRPPSNPAVAIGRAALIGTNRAARVVTRKVITASKPDGAEESGLTALIWNQVLSYGTDAMVTVALAGTVFFGASANAQRGNVLLYLLITMAPFALVAPVIGPILDRLQHGRRWTMAGTAVGRAILAMIMAAHPTELLVLYPCALGSLVLSKAYGVIRASAAPRLVPRNMTLTEANARLTIFGLGSTIVLGGLVGVIIKVTGSYSLGLIVTAVGFAACAVFAFRLPPQVDSAVAAPRHPQEPLRPRTQQPVPSLHRIQLWARRGFDDQLVIALQGESALRLLSGLLTIYLAFYVETTTHGLTGALQLGAVVLAAAAGNFAGTAIGTMVKMAKPELVIIVSTCVAGATCLLISVIFDITLAVAAVFVSAVANAQSKIALDALIQRDVVETLRSSAFARSETFLQLAWVVGATFGVALPSSPGNGTFGFLVAGLIVGGVGVIIILRHRATSRAAAARKWTQQPGNVAHRGVD